MTKRWLRVGEAAAELERTEAAIHQLIDRGDLPAYRRGRDLYIHRPDLDDYQQAVEIDDPPAAS